MAVFGDFRLPPRFWAKARLNAATGCWEWQAGTFTDGYAAFYWNGGTRRGHRVAYEALRTELTDGLVLDHLCRVITCVNPMHLEEVTTQVNTRRGTGPAPGQIAAAAARRLQTECLRGHEYTDDNTTINRAGQRSCKECAREKSKLFQRKVRQRKANLRPKPEGS